jgi:hypothetical protein
MDAHFTAVADPHHDLVRLTLAGFFTVADVARFDAALYEAFSRMRCGPNAHLTVCDASGMKIQTQDVVAAFAAVMANPSHRSRRLAIVTSASLARMQARRLTKRAEVGYFSDMAEAEAWLLAAAYTGNLRRAAAG